MADKTVKVCDYCKKEIEPSHKHYRIHWILEGVALDICINCSNIILNVCNLLKLNLEQVENKEIRVKLFHIVKREED